MQAPTLNSCSVRNAAIFGQKMSFHGKQTSRAANLRMAARSDNALIINTKGGGHAFLGLHLAKALLKGGHKVTIFNDGDEGKLKAKDPYSQYDSLAAEGVTIQFGDPADAGSLPDGPFDIVYDNNGKKLEVCQPAIDKYKGNVQHYAFVASAGAYKADDIEPMLVEGDERKASAGHVEVEKYLEEQDLPYTVFQPQYIYGPYTNKDCEQFFIDRIIRDRPVPVPAPGIQLVNLSHVEDLASMLATVPGNAAAVKQEFNLASDRAITLDGVVRVVAKALGKEANIVHFDPAKFPKAFPFRTGHFFTSADKAKRVLGWQPQHDFLKDIDDLVAAYKASGRDQKDIDFSGDDEIIAASS